MTKAMQMIAAAKLKKAQSAAVASKPYTERLEYLSKTLEDKVDKDSTHEYMKENIAVNSKLLIVISPDKGLCGGLVTNLMREVLHYDGSGKLYFIAVGKKAENIISSLNKELIASFPFGTTLPPFETVYPIAKLVDEYFLGQKVSEVKILSTKFSSVFSQVPKFTDLLPVKTDGQDKVKDSTVVFEPDAGEFLPGLLQHYLEMIIYQSLLESYASEQASRMIAMKNATDNASDIISELQLEYNKTRQEKITNELLDIGSGAQINYE